MISKFIKKMLGIREVDVCAIHDREYTKEKKPARTDVICAIDTETTGLTHGYHEIIQIAILPLVFTPGKDFLKPLPDQALNLRIKARYPERANSKAMEINGLDPNEGMEPYKACCEILFYLSALQKTADDKIILLGQNLKFELDFIDNLPFLSCAISCKFCRRRRDTMVVAAGMNDAADFAGTPRPFPDGLSLDKLAAALGVKADGHHDALADCHIAATVYRAQLKMIVKPVNPLAYFNPFYPGV